GWLLLAAGLGLGLGFFSTQYAQHALVAVPASWPAGRAAAWFANWLSARPHRGLFTRAADALARGAESASRGARPLSWLTGHPGAEGPDNAVPVGLVPAVGGGAGIPDQAVVDGGHQRLCPVRRAP